MPRTLARPHETVGLQAPRAQSHSCTVVDKHFEPVGTPVSKHVGVVRLRAQCEAAHDLAEQLVDAPSKSLAPSANPMVCTRIIG